MAQVGRFVECFDLFLYAPCDGPMKQIFCILALLFVTSAFAQKLPFVVGAVAETGYGILSDGTDGAGLNRMTPFIGAWINGIGYCRLGYGLYNY